MASVQRLANRFIGTTGCLAGGVVAAVVSASAFAQSSQTLTVTFSGPSTAVPLSGWLSVAVALVIAASAILAFRRGGKAKLWTWPAVFLTAGALYAGAIGDTLAILGPTLFISLTSSPGTVVVPGSGPVTVIVEVDNATGQQVKIGSVSLTSGPYGIAVNGCTTGLVLPPNGSCLITLGES